MIKAIDEEFCIGCGLCTDVCQNDVLRLGEGKAYIAYPSDCTHCMECFCYCPTETITMGRTAIPKKFDANAMWQQIQDDLNLK